MKNQKIDEEKNWNDLKLTDEEIKNYDNFTNLSEIEIREMKEAIFNLSIILFKCTQHEQS